MPAGGMNTQTDTLVGYGQDKANPGGLIEDNDTIGQTVPKSGSFTTITSTEGYSSQGDITLADGKAIKTDTTTAHTAVLQAYDVNGAAYKTFATLTNGDTPSFAIAAPSGGTVTINGSTIGGETPAAATFTTVTADTSVIVKGSSTGTTTYTSANAGATNYTRTIPAVTGTEATTSGSNLFIADVTRCTSSLTKNASAAYANVTGLSQTVVPGTYAFVCRLPSTVANGTGGIKYAFNYTTTVLSAIESTGRGFTASAVAVQHTTTTTTQTDLFTQAAVVIYTEITGTMVVTTGGTIDLQMAQNTSNGSDTIALIGGSMEFVRIA